MPPTFAVAQVMRPRLNQAMRDLTDPFWIKFKGILFLFVGMASAVLVFLENPSLRMAVLLAICIWCFCRLYYFAFYVIEKYVDGKYRFSGLWSFAQYLFAKSKKNDDATTDGHG